MILKKTRNKDFFVLITILSVFFVTKSPEIAKSMQILVMLLFSIAFFKISKKTLIIFLYISVYFLISSITSNVLNIENHTGYILYMFYLMYILFIIDSVSSYNPSMKNIKIIKNTLFVFTLLNGLFFFIQLYGYQGALNNYFYGDLSEREHWMQVRPSGFLGNSNITVLATFFVFLISSGNRKLILFLLLILMFFAVEPMMSIILFFLYIIIEIKNVLDKKYFISIALLFLILMPFVLYSYIESLFTDFSFLHRLDTIINISKLSWMELLFGGNSMQTFMLDNNYKFLDNIIVIMILNIGFIGLVIYFISISYLLSKKFFDSFIVISFLIQQITFPLISNFLILFLFLICARVKNVENNNNITISKESGTN